MNMIERFQPPRKTFLGMTLGDWGLGILCALIFGVLTYGVETYFGFWRPDALDLVIAYFFGFRLGRVT